MDDRSKIAMRLDGLQRFIMNNTLSGVLPLYIVTEYPKSGGTWLGQMLSDYFNMPFPRNQRPRLVPSIMHGHYKYYRVMKNVVVLFRDGRDVMVSEYYYTLFPNDKASPLLMRQARSDLEFNDYDDVRENLPRFIEYIFEKKSCSKSPFQFTWTQFVQSWMGKGACFIKYEEMVDDAVEALRPVVETLGGRPIDLERLERVAEKYSFENQTGRKAGKERKGSFLRKGTYGDWREKFSPTACDVFDEYAGEELIALGYEADRTWKQAAMENGVNK